MAVPRRTGRLTFWVLQGFSCLLMKHFQLKPLVSKDFAIAKCQTTPRETDNTNFLSFAVLDLETIHNTIFFLHIDDKKNTKQVFQLQKEWMILFSGFPTSFLVQNWPPGRPCWAGSGSNTAPFLCLSYQLQQPFALKEFSLIFGCVELTFSLKNSMIFSDLVGVLNKTYVRNRLDFSNLRLAIGFSLGFQVTQP